LVGCGGEAQGIAVADRLYILETDRSNVQAMLAGEDSIPRES
jgi:hypothetical protein